jgi:two-component system sensor histidine kinase/response regulator
VCRWRFDGLPDARHGWLRGDKEKVLACGMNDYIAKPIDPERMLRVMAKWIRAGAEQVVEDVE